MPDLDASFFIFCLLLGALMGHGLGRNAADRPATLAAALSCIAVGAITWMVASSGTQPEIAGASMATGGLSALLVLTVTGRRITSSPGA
ncbi:MAG TPA: hypothetical protein VMS74_04045 [Acidimicrobiia bacterium]|nr:hypothetical protein [Acidimicrobiia bacterium]